MRTKPLEISASVRVSTKIGDDFCTFEYYEKRQVNCTEEELEQERELLWQQCNYEVDQQIDITFDRLRRL